MPKRRTLDNILTRFYEVHGNFYDYSFITEVSGIHKVDIICPIHGLFTQNITDHYNGSGCPKCAKRKREQTNLQKYGVKHTLQSIPIREKGQKTRLRLYGDKNFNNRQKCKKTMLNQYGKPNPSQVRKFKQKRIKTFLKNMELDMHYHLASLLTNESKLTYKNMALIIFLN